MAAGGFQFGLTHGETARPWRPTPDNLETGQRDLESQVMRAIRLNRWHYGLVGFLPVDIRWRRRARSDHGPSSTTEIYLLHGRHPGEGVGRLCVPGVEPHHL